MSQQAIEMFCLNRGIRTSEITQADNPAFSQALQSQCNDYLRGWESASDGEGSFRERAEKQYSRMVANHASLGTVSRNEYVHGFVDCLEFSAKRDSQ